jgi:hypothetical protein
MWLSKEEREKWPSLQNNVDASNYSHPEETKAPSLEWQGTYFL